MISISSFAGTLDTLKVYNPRSSRIIYTQPNITTQAARFNVRRPCRLRRVSITLGGKVDDGSATIHIYGHEGGLSVPLSQKDIIPPIKIRKSVPGMQTISFELKETPIISNNQFFIAVDSLSNGVFLLSDNEPKKASCASQNKEIYSYQALKYNDGTWHYSIYAYLVEAEIEYIAQEYKPFFQPDTIAINPPLLCHNHNKGIACADVNADGYLDLLVNGRLFLNNKDGRMLDITANAGIESGGVPDAGVFIDCNNDTKPDILFIGVHNDTSSANAVLYINEGNYKFHAQALTFPKIEYISSISIADVNNDGLLDIFIGQYGANTKNYLLINNGKTLCEFRTEFLDTSSGHCRGSSFVDFNMDGLADLYIANYGSPNEVWVNQGGGKFRYENENTESTKNYSRGCHWADMDNDGYPDLLLPQYSKSESDLSQKITGTGVYKSRRGQIFSPMENQHSGIEYEEKHSGGAWGDINNDGLLDCITTTSCPCRFADIYIQNKDALFELSTHEYGLDSIADSQDGLWADLDNDGLLDLVLFNVDKLSIYKQSGPPQGNYVELDLQSKSGNVSAIGGHVAVYNQDHVSFREMTSGRGLLMQDPLRLHFGIGASSSIDSVVVYWPGRTIGETYRDIETNQLTTLVEGESGKNRNNVSILSEIKTFPNPFTQHITISYKTLQPAHIKIDILTLTGSKVKTLIDEWQESGDHFVKWTGETENGIKAPTGTYIYNCLVNDFQSKGSINFIK